MCVDWSRMYVKRSVLPKAAGGTWQARSRQAGRGPRRDNRRQIITNQLPKRMVWMNPEVAHSGPRVTYNGVPKILEKTRDKSHRGSNTDPSSSIPGDCPQARESIRDEGRVSRLVSGVLVVVASEIGGGAINTAWREFWWSSSPSRPTTRLPAQQ